MMCSSETCSDENFIQLQALSPQLSYLHSLWIPFCFRNVCWRLPRSLGFTIQDMLCQFGDRKKAFGYEQFVGEREREREMNWQYLPHLPLVVLLCLSSCIGVASRVNLIANGLGLTPPMGWNSWNRFQCDINETLIKETADAIVSSGLAKLGYQYVNLDDCWAEYNRTAKGELVGKRSTFPSGIKALADYVHSRGLKLGIYSSAGYRTCSNRMPGSLGYENTDAKTFASWGIDYLKYDNCYNGGINETKRYPEMSRALQKSGRSIFYNLCAWGHAGVAKWGFKFGNSWRTTTDIRDNWTSIISIADENEAFAEYARPGGWNDPDMLEIGNGGMTQNEYIVHFSLWAISKAPLLLGCDIRTMSEKAMAIVANQEVIAINQDPIGVQAKKVNKDEDLEVWAGPLAGGRTVALLLNLSSKKSHFVTANWHDLGLATNTIVQARDVWKHETFKVLLTNKLTAKVGPHSCKMFVLKPSTG